MLMFYLQRSSWISAVTLLAAFVLTFWSGRLISRLAAALYSVGTLVGFGVSTYVWIFFAWINYHLTDAPSANPAVLAPAFAVSLAPFLYALGAVVLLSPRIPQAKALRLGKILHLIVLPLTVLIVTLATIFQPGGQVFGYVGWLLYPLLWFRIRESYAGMSGTNPADNLQPTQEI